MQRLLDQALSIFSPSKRRKRSRKDAEDRLANPTVSTPGKRLKSISSSSDVAAHLDSIERLQSRLLAIDKDCAKEQILIQRRFDETKRPVLEQRQTEILQIPNFWVVALGNHPATDPAAFVADRSILSLLTTIDLEDNIDDNGSYILRFKFDADKNPFFSESVLERKVLIQSDQSETVLSTCISWAPDKRPKHPKSFFAWFASTGAHGPIEEDFGEVLRRDLWQNPYPYYLNIGPSTLGQHQLYDKES